MLSDCPFHEQNNYRMGIIEQRGGEIKKILFWAKAAARTTHTHTAEGCGCDSLANAPRKTQRSLCRLHKWQRERDEKGVGVEATTPRLWPNRHNQRQGFGTDFRPSSHSDLRLFSSCFIIIRTLPLTPPGQATTLSPFTKLLRAPASSITIFICPEKHIWLLFQCYMFLLCVCVSMGICMHTHT